MKIGIAVIAATVVLGASAASAQPGWYGYGYGSPYGGRPYYDAMPRHRVFSVVRSVGLRPVSEAVRMGPNFIVDAVDSSGRLKRVTVSAYYGQVVRIATVSRPDFPPRRAAPFERPGIMPDDADAMEEAGPPPRVQRPPAQARLPAARDEDEPLGSINEEAPPMPPAGIARRGAVDTPTGRDIPPPPAPLNMRKATKPIPSEKKTARGSEETGARGTGNPSDAGDRSAAVNPHPASRSIVRHAPLELKPTEKPAAAKPIAKPAAQAAAPRVVLPGGPPPKAAATPAAAPAYAPAYAPPPVEKPAVAAPAPGSSDIPPVQSLD